MDDLPQKKKETFQDLLLEWHKGNERKFPWRKTNDAYQILCTEILLQQTNAEKVEKIYNEFFEKFPNVEALGEATPEEIGEVIKGLGLYKRAEHLVNAARVLLERFDGNIPEEENVIHQIPGVGVYTAGSVACFAYEKKTGLVDTNTVRIRQRVFGIDSERSRPRTDPDIKNLLDQLTDVSEPKKFNYALLDFGAKICKQRNPLCEECPMNNFCDFYQAGGQKNGI